MNKYIALGVAVLLGVCVLVAFVPHYAGAQTPPSTVKQGGTGWGGWVAGTIPIGPGTGTTALRFATSSQLTFATSTGTLSTNILSLLTALTVANGGTGRATFTSSQLLYGNGTNALSSVATTSVSCSGAVSCTGFTAIGASPITISASAVTSPIATSSSETATYVPFWTSTAGTPALLSGGVAGFAFNSSASRLTVTNASTTAFSSSWIGATTATIGSATGIAITTSGVFSTIAGTTCTNQFLRAFTSSGGTCATVSLTADVTGILPIANGGTNASSFGTSNGITAYDGTRLVNFSGYTLTSALLTAANASTTNLSSSAGATFATASGFVGIGTTTPWAKLSINPVAGDNGAPSFVIGSSSLNHFIVTNVGRVGLATTSPFARFTLGNDGTASSSIAVAEYRPATTTAATIDCRSSNQHKWRIGLSATTLTLGGLIPGQKCVVVVENPNGTAGALTWAASSGYILLWSSGTTPTQTTTANKQDVWSFLATQGSSTMAILGAQTAGF